MATQLVPLPEVERLSASVIRILAGNPGKVGNPVGNGRWEMNWTHRADTFRDIVYSTRYLSIIQLSTMGLDRG